MQVAYPIRVAQVIGKMWAGGVESVVFNYYRYINKDMIQFDFFYDEDSTVEPPKDIIEMGARFYKMPPYKQVSRYIRTLKKYFRRNNYSIVHSHLNTLSIIPLSAAWSVNIPIRIAHNHSVPGGNEWRRNGLKYTLRMGAKIFPTDYFACSEKAGRWLFGNKAYEQGRVLVIKNAIDFNKFQIDKSVKNNIMQKLDLNNKFIVGHVGRFTFAKNHLFLLQVFACIKKYRTDAILLLVGDGELRKLIEAEIEMLGVEKSVIMIGQTNQPESYYSIMDVLIMPSVFEGLGLTAIEAQVSGVPVVLSKAIPQEAVITEGCIYHDISEPVDVWAMDAIKISGKNIKKLVGYNSYEITSAARKLGEWYEKKILSM
jgi:glycosyltransferase involved in cell wall biosynthesis